MANWLITGVGGGLGLALAKAALARGDRVAGTARKAADCSAFEARAPGRAFGFQCDMADEAGVRAAAAGALAALGGIDILVNNVGYGLVGAVEEASLGETRAQFEVNVFGPLALIQAVLPAMRARRSGHIVNITSVSGLATWAGTGIYCASKFALEAIGETLAQEVEPLGVKVTNVEPGGMRTDYAGRSLVRTQTVIADYEGPGHDAARILAEHAGEESGDPAKVAQAILSIAGVDDPPLHLILGADAMFYATRKLGALQAEIGRWGALSYSTGFSEEG